MNFSVTVDDGLVLEKVGVTEVDGEQGVWLEAGGSNFTGSLVIPATFIGVKTFAVLAVTSNGDVKEAYGSREDITVTSKPDLSTLASIYTDPQEVACSPGFEDQLKAIGVLSDGTAAGCNSGYGFGLILPALALPAIKLYRRNG